MLRPYKRGNVKNVPIVVFKELQNMKAHALFVGRIALVLAVFLSAATQGVYAASSVAPRATGPLVLQSALVNNRANGPLTVNGCNTLIVSLRNAGDTAATGVSATLIGATPGVRITQPRSTYPDIAAGAGGTNATPFQISTAANLACGAPVVFLLRVATASGERFDIRLRFTVGTVFNASFESTEVPKNIPDGVRLRPGVASSSLQVSGFSGAAAKVTASLYLTHSYLSDLQITLIAPDNTRVLLSDRSGEDGDSFGLSSANRTKFDDAATPLLQDGRAPFLGAFEPDQPLAAFAGKSGTALNGRWRLEIKDNAGGDVGTLRNWGLTIQRVTCQNGGGGCGATEAPSLVVTTVADTIDATDGRTSLREAILFANAKPDAAGGDRISFRLPGSGARVIKVGNVSGTALPAITMPVVIDGRSQPGFAGTPLVVLDGTATPRNVDGLLLTSDGSTIQGLAINSFDRAAINIEGSRNVIVGNILGTNLANTREIGSNSGVLVNGANNRIGGASAADFNVIGGNNAGITLSGTTTSGNVVQGNRIGMSLDGRARIPNAQSGVLIAGGAARNTIGGAARGEGNRIAYNGEHGVAVMGASTTGNTIRANNIVANGGLGINLDSGAETTPFVTLNDEGDADSGPNGLQNFPVLTSAASGGGRTSVVGRFHSQPNATHVLDFYANTILDPSQFGEGQIYLGSTSVTTGADGMPNTPDKLFRATLPANVVAGRFVSATATDAQGSTSEFARGIAVAAAAVVQFSAATYSASENGVASISLTRSGDLSATSVRVEFRGGTATASSDYSPVARTIAFAAAQTSASFTVPIVNDSLVEANETIELALVGAGANGIIGARSTAVLTILNDDLAPRITVTRGALQPVGGSYTGGLYGAAPRYREIVTVRNEGGGSVAGPFSLALDNLSGNGVQLQNADGITNQSAPAGSPFVNFSAGADNLLGAGEAIEVVLEFTTRDSGISYTPRVIAGAAPR